MSIASSKLSTVPRASQADALRLKVRLDELLTTHDVDRRKAADPVSLVHRYDDPRDQEVVGLIAASLAFGQVLSVRRSTERVLSVLGKHPADVITSAGEGELRKSLCGFAHRIYRESHVARLLAGAGALLRQYGSLGDAFVSDFTDAHADLREGAARFSDRLRGADPERGLKHLIADPRAGSACKRLLLYLRWMARPADGVDLGLWPLSASELVIPLDTHVHRISINLGLTTRRDASWRTAEEITAALRAFDSDDPVKYDFAICHMGVSRQCPSRHDPEKCAPCVLREVCNVWTLNPQPSS